MHIIDILLKSELCSGSGEGLGSAIDSDVCYDSHGFPFIPARRIKGLLKEASDELLDYGMADQETIDSLYGIPGNTKSGSLVISDGKIENIDIIEKQIDNLSGDYKKYLTVQRILKQFTSIRYATSINDFEDILLGNKKTFVKENSLRSMRVVNKGVHFQCVINTLNKQERKLLENCCKLVKHMGISRTRGYGEVIVTLKDFQSEKKSYDIQLKDDQEYTLKVLYKSITPLMMSKERTNDTELYISGTSIMSSIANNYLKDHPDDSKFYDLFINGKVKYSNAYVSNSNQDEFIPVPASYAKVKDASLQNENSMEYVDKMYSVNSTSQVSFIKNKFISYDNGIKMKEVKLSMNYHSRRAKDKAIGHVVEGVDGGMFYQLVSLQSNQYFLESIQGKGNYLKEIIPYIQENIYVGKSRTAQYGNLHVEDITAIEQLSTNKNNYKSFAVILKSPLYLLDNLGQATVSIDEVTNRIKQLVSDNVVLDQSFVSYTTISGYNNKWNLPKPQINIFNGGSVFVYTTKTVHYVKETIKIIKSQISEDNKIIDQSMFDKAISSLANFLDEAIYKQCLIIINEAKEMINENHLWAKNKIDECIAIVEKQQPDFIVNDSYILGENQNEGLGQIIIKDASYHNPEVEIQASDNQEYNLRASELEESTKKVLINSLYNVLNEQLLSKAIDNASITSDINNTTIGKVLLFIREAESLDNKRLENLTNNINNIKDVKKLNRVMKTLENVPNIIDEIKEYQLMNEIRGSQDIDEFDKLCIAYLKQYFIQLKLKGRGLE